MKPQGITMKLRAAFGSLCIYRSISSFPQVLMLPGQGSQRCGMAKDLLSNFKEAKYVYEEVDEAVGAKITEISTSGSDVRTSSGVAL
jgi:acyl transferase domain-containing protein